MAIKLNPYLNFDGQCEEAFLFYKKVFGGEFTEHGIMRLGDMPPSEEFPVPEEFKNRVMHVSLPIGNEILMGSDTMPGMGSPFQKGVNNYISVSPNSREEADRLFSELSEGGTVEMPMADMFWGDYYGSFIDKFGTPWMINYNSQYQS
ncbi:MAG: VOC family protein [Niabella sp.]